MNDEYIKRSEVNRIISNRVKLLEGNTVRGKGLMNAIINLKAVQAEIDELYGVEVKFEGEPIWRKQT